jgi:hypothetical protein
VHICICLFFHCLCSTSLLDLFCAPYGAVACVHYSTILVLLLREGICGYNEKCLQFFLEESNRMWYCVC